MVQRIDRDLQRFRKIVRGHIKKDLRKYMSSGELVGKKGKNLVSIPIRQIELPTFRHETRKKEGVGQGDGEAGQPVGSGEDGSGEAGDAPGNHKLEVDVTFEELAEIMAEELELPNIKPRSKRSIETDSGKYTTIGLTGPESLRHFRRTFKEALKRQIASGAYNKKRPVIIPIKEDRRYRARKTIRLPVHLLDKLAKVRRISAVMSEELGREPSDEELSEETGIPIRKLSLLRQASQKPASLDAPMNDDASSEFGDMISDDRALDPSDAMESKNLHGEIGDMMDSLDERESRIINARFGLDGVTPMTLEEVGREFGVSRERIRQLQTIALQKMRSVLRKKDKPLPALATIPVRR